jgi:hypothetical protein
MSEAGPSTPQMRTIRLPGEQRNIMFDPAPRDWSAADTNMYNRPGVQMILGSQVTQIIWDYVELLLSSSYVTRSAAAILTGVGKLSFQRGLHPGHGLDNLQTDEVAGSKGLSKV